jgi:hypothetical protein
MIEADVLRLRLANQCLTVPSAEPSALVKHLGAVQSQDYSAAKWALGLRLRAPNPEAIEAAFAAGKILRTHVLRPTWHFVAPTDIRWMLSLSGSRIRASVAAYTRSLGLDESTVARCSGVVGQALRGGKSLTRPRIRDVMREAGVIETDGATLGHILLHLELDGLVCSGPREGLQHTYALLDERAPDEPVLDREAAVAELTWRYFNSHGPALVRDCAWWSGLSIGEINRGLEANASRLQGAVLDERTYWFSPVSVDDCPAASGTAYLLPNYDEYTVAYRERDLYYDREANSTGDPRMDVPFRHVLLVDGQVMGRWSATVRQSAVAISLQWSMTPTRLQKEAIVEAARRYAAFLGVRCELASA